VFLSQSDLDVLTATLQAFTPERLTLAREASGLEVKELAERVGTTPSAISQLEHGNTRPRTETLLRLSLALSVPPQFFAAGKPPVLPETACHFRRRRGAPKREQRAVLARGTMVREVVRHLEEFVEFPSDAITPLTRPATTIEEAERLAAHVREAWRLGMGPISDVIGLLELHGVIPVEVRGHSHRLDAFSVWAEGRPMVFLSTDKGIATRRRFDAAHELLHLIAHRDHEVGDPALESVADRFASAFLLPEAPFRAECPARLSWPVLREMKRRWGVSLLALVRRAFDLGIYSEATYRRASVQWAQHGWREMGEPDEPTMERPTLVQHVVAQLAEAGHPPSAVAAALHYDERLLRSAVWPNDSSSAA
jgi:Zn-dependent peptidase ImmA (M78 family)/transcriptional regulator with XRE-family HTH domain